MRSTSSRRLTAEVTHIPGTEWNGLRVSDPLGGQEVCWEDLTEDETRLLKLAADLEHTEVAWIHLQDLIYYLCRRRGIAQ